VLTRAVTWHTRVIYYLLHLNPISVLTMQNDQHANTC